LKITFKKIPTLAKLFYLVGFIIIVISYLNYDNGYQWFTTLETQQFFIFGAIVVAIGSIINSLYQFKSR